MKVDKTHPNASQWTKLLLVSGVLYLSQIYPYSHFHHTHGNHEESSIQNLISLKQGSEKFSPSQDWHQHDGILVTDREEDHHEDGEGHHHHFDQHIDCFLIRSNARSAPVFPDLSVLAICSNLNYIEKSVSIEISSEKYSRPECIPIGPIDSRGPPVLG